MEAIQAVREMKKQLDSIPYGEKDVDFEPRTSTFKALKAIILILKEVEA